MNPRLIPAIAFTDAIGKGRPKADLMPLYFKAQKWTSADHHIQGGDDFIWEAPSSKWTSCDEHKLSYKGKRSPAF